MRTLVSQPIKRLWSEWVPFWLKIVVIALGCFIVLFALSNIGYFWRHVTYESQIPATEQPPRGEPNKLSIPGLGIEAPIQYVDKADEDVFQEALLGGVVHYPGTALPGQAGNIFIFGHSSDYLWSKGKFKTVFALLPKIENGTEIFITNKEGNQFTYVVTETLVVKPSDTHVLAQDYSKYTLTLQTSYPVGTALRRYIVQAELK